jgi:hypothetical protein
VTITIVAIRGGNYASSTRRRPAGSGARHNLAYETGVNRYTFATPKGDVLDVGKYLLVWKKVAGKWYIAAISASSDAPSPVPVK